jgi:transcriptional regulator with XRE-family HTH domain
MSKLDIQKPVAVEQRVFAKNFKAARVSRGITQQQIHEISGVGQAYLSDLERHRINGRIDTLAKLSHTVHIPLYHLLQPDFERTYDFSNTLIWTEYTEKLNDSDGICYERKLLIRNFIAARLASKLRKKEITALTGISNDFLIDFERGEIGIGIDRATKLAQVVAQPLFTLLKP